ncbi:nucleoporin 50 kDabarA [Klebsormidium nitens]|uniref:Nucleoporin 50 kDabarA n=1 Tax=Klebsormidium nitens TaxID=105231 RepID=A0A0U9HPH4_KLENI|nr:nucleoporin 50 kDabarA [Klebsormidium nitens]|eukprot:GAQ89751.1 nucleoporin 50 kDabarA [Klebsormidium nitens]
MADEPSRKKRTSERQLTKDDFSRDDDEQEEAEPQGTFAKASDDVMQKRKVVKARRPGASVVPAPAAVNPFAAVSLLSAGAGAGGTPPTPAPPAPEPEAPKTDKGESPAVAVAVEAAAGEEEEGEEVNKGDRKEPVGGASTSGQAPPEEAKKPPTTPGFGGFGKFAGSNAFGTGFGAGTGGGFGSAAGSTPSPFSFNFGTGAAGTSASFGSTPAFGAGASSFPSLSSVFGGTNGAPVQLFGGPGSSAASNDGEADEEGGGSSLPQPAPVVQLTEVKVETGEEKETAAFAADATLYEFAGGWKERGKGEVRVNVPADGAQRARLVMRARGNLRLLLNAHIYPGLKLSRMDGRGVSFAVVNHAGEAGGGMGTWAVRMKDAGTAAEFAARVEELKGRVTEGGEKKEGKEEGEQVQKEEEGGTTQEEKTEGAEKEGPAEETGEGEKETAKEATGDEAV